MAIGNLYRSIASHAIFQGANFEQWQKTAEMDKLFLLLYDQIDGRNSAATRVGRATAMVEYLAIKKLLADSAFFGNLANGELRATLRDHSYTNSLTTQNQAQFGLCGRFHRIVSQVLNETDQVGGAQSEEAIFKLWANSAVLGMAEGLDIFVSPFVVETTGYRLNADPIVENTGAAIPGTDGVTRIRLFTSAINFTSQIWQKDTVDIPGEIEDKLDLNPAVIADTGVYRNSYTNASGTTFSEDFNVVVT